MSKLEYKTVSKTEAFGKNAIGIHIMVASSIPVDMKAEQISQALFDADEAISSAIQAEIISKDPESAVRARAERSALTALFKGRIFVEEVPNGYCSRACCHHLPWFVVTTEIGRFKIGWRKSVIHLEWTETLVTASAKELFPEEDVTKIERVIHAWGYDKAASYIETIVAAFNLSARGSPSL